MDIHRSPLVGVGSALRLTQPTFHAAGGGALAGGGTGSTTVGCRAPFLARSAMSRSLAWVSGFTMPAEMMILAASSTLMWICTTFLRGTKHTKPDGGSMPVGMNTLTRSCPGISLVISRAASPVTNTIDQMPLEGNSITATFWKLCCGEEADTTDSKICLRRW